MALSLGATPRMCDNLGSSTSGADRTGSEESSVAIKNRTTGGRAQGPAPLTDDEIRAMIDVEARKQLGMSGGEFIERWRRHELPYSPVAFDLGIFAHFLETSPKPTSST